MAKQINEINSDSEEKDILETIQKITDSSISTDPHMLSKRSFELEYCFNILNIKQQQKLLREQNDFNRKMLTTNKWLVGATIVLVAVTLGLGIYSYTLSANNQSAMFMLEFNKEIRNTTEDAGGYSGITNAIETKKPIVSMFSDEKIDNYLVMWELLDNVYRHKLISFGMAYDAFSYDTEMAYCNNDIQKYLKKSNSTLNTTQIYGGFIDLAKLFLKKDTTDCIQVNK